jgi:hypothetical protein
LKGAYVLIYDYGFYFLYLEFLTHNWKLRAENHTKVAPGRSFTFDSARSAEFDSARSAAKSLIPRVARGFYSARSARF